MDRHQYFISKAKYPLLLPSSTSVVSPAMIVVPTSPPTTAGTNPRVLLYTAPVMPPHRMFFWKDVS